MAAAIGGNEDKTRTDSIDSTGSTSSSETAYGRRTTGALQKHGDAFDGGTWAKIKTGAKAVGRGLWSAVKGILTNRVTWGLALIGLAVVCPWTIPAIILGVAGAALFAYGTYQNTKETYQLAQDLGLGKGWSVALAGAAALVNIGAAIATVFTFGAAAAFSIKAQAGVHAAVTWIAGKAGAHAAAQFATGEAVKDGALALAGAGLIVLPGGIEMAKDWKKRDQQDQSQLRSRGRTESASSSSISMDFDSVKTREERLEDSQERANRAEAIVKLARDETTLLEAIDDVKGHVRNELAAEFWDLCDHYLEQLDAQIKKAKGGNYPLGDCISSVQNIITKVFDEERRKFRVAFLEMDKHPNQAALLAKFPAFNDNNYTAKGGAVFYNCHWGNNDAGRLGALADEAFAEIDRINSEKD
jgi:hypothetical protein